MTNDDQKNLDMSIEFLDNLSLPDISAFEGVEGDPISLLPPNFFDPAPQTVTVGSQLAGFAASVPVELRPHISNSFLLAQLAANKHLGDTDGNSQAWYKKYTQVLSNIGWVIEGDASAMREVRGTNLQVHHEILAVFTAALGPMATAASTILNVLKSLENMNKDQPWITLFNRESQRAKANQFQMSFATADGGTPRITLACFELEASNLVVQVLFFKFADSHATLRHSEVKMSMNEAIFNAVKDKVQSRLVEHVDDFISDIEI